MLGRIISGIIHRDAGLAINKASELEVLVTEKFPDVRDLKGLGQKFYRIKDIFPKHIQDDMSYIISERNKIGHTEQKKLENEQRYIAAYKRVKKYIKNYGKNNLFSYLKNLTITGIKSIAAISIFIFILSVLLSNDDSPENNEDVLTPSEPQEKIESDSLEARCNRQTDRIFYEAYPEMEGKSISANDKDYSKIWLQMRGDIKGCQNL